MNGEPFNLQNMKIKVYRDLMGANDQWADKTRRLLAAKNVKMINLIGSPGAGKTALLEETIKLIAGRLKVGRDSLSRRGRTRLCGPTLLKIAVLEGDIATQNDAKRLAKLNCRVSQLLTGGACHLEAKMVHYALRDLPLGKLDLVIVENVGNLVCPAEFDIGEHAKAVVLSVTEGEDKPQKYPTIFREAKAIVISKTDLLPNVPFKLKKCLALIRRINPRTPIFQISAVTGQGMDEWLDWLTALARA